MGKVIFEFDSQTESMKIRDTLNATDWKLAMWELDQRLRSVTKTGYALYGNREATKEEIKAAEDIRKEIRDILSESNLDFGM